VKQVGLYAVLLGAAMIGSYVTWTADKGGTPDEGGGVAVYRASPGDVTKLAWQAPKLKVLAERRTDATGPYVWVAIDETREKPRPPKPHDHDADHPDGDTDTDAAAGPEVPEPVEAPPELETTHTEFLGSEGAEGLFTSFEPLMALRELSTDGVDTKTFGFDGEPTQLIVTRTAGELAIEMGGETYGAKDRYARSEGRVYLLEDTAVRPLQFALTRLQETRLHPFAEADLDRVTVNKNGNILALVQQNKADRAAAYWAREGSLENRDETAATWLGKLMRMKAQSYPSAADLPATEPALTIELVNGKQAWTLDILRSTSDGALYARSSFNRATVQLTASLAAEAIADVDELFQE
jgi:hypothetical protein